MKWVLLALAIIGVTASSLALREKYRPYGESPCDINERWDCGIVNHSPYSVIHGIPVAVIGIAGYLVLGILSLRRAYRLMLAGALAGLAFSIYLAHIEDRVLGVWCIYCAISLGTISLITLLLLATVLRRTIRRRASS